MTTRSVVHLPLANVADVVRGVSFQKRDVSDLPAPNRTPVLRAGNIGVELELHHDLIWVPSQFVSSNQLLRPMDIVMCASSGSAAIVGKSALLRRVWEGTVGAFCVIVRPNWKYVDPYFLAFFFRSRTFREWTRNSQGASIKNIRKTGLEDFLVPLPPIDEQRRIVGILNQAAKIERLRAQAADCLREFIPALFVRMFGDPVENPMGWEVEPLGNLIAKGPQNGLYRPKSQYGSGAPILRIDSFRDGNVTDPSGWQRVRLDGPTVNKYALVEGDIVINRVNSRPFLGKSAIIPKMGEIAVFESNMMRLHVHAGRILPDFIISMLQIGSMRSRLCVNAKDAINQSSINQTDVSRLLTIIPPLELQQRFIEIGARARAADVVGESCCRTASALSASLMNRLLDDAA